MIPGFRLISRFMMSAGLFITSCKTRDAAILSVSGHAARQPKAAKQYELCKVSPLAWSGLSAAVSAMEKAGKSSVQISQDTSDSEPLSATALELFNRPHDAGVPSCGESLDQALAESPAKILTALSKSSSGSVLALHGIHEVETSSGIMSITRLPSGHYRIEILGLAGRQRSEMIMSPQQLKGLAGTLLRGV